jgi:hypothetical protein
MILLKVKLGAVNLVYRLQIASPLMFYKNYTKGSSSLPNLTLLEVGPIQQNLSGTDPAHRQQSWSYLLQLYIGYISHTMLS